MLEHQERPRTAYPESITVPKQTDYTTSGQALQVIPWRWYFVVCKMQRAAAGRCSILSGVREEADSDGEHDEIAEARERDGDCVPAERQAKKALGSREKRRYRRVLRNENGGYGSAGGHTGREIAGLV